MIRPMTPPTASHPNEVTTLGKLRLLLWKNFLLQKRHKIHTIVDVFLPVVFFLFCAWLQAKTDTKTFPQMKYYSLPIDSKDLFTSEFRLYPPIKEERLIFTPNNEHFKHLLETVSRNLNFDKPPIGVNSSDQLETTLVEKGLIAGIEFHHPNNTNDLPKSLSYSLRFPSELRRDVVANFGQSEPLNWKTDRLFSKNAFSPYFPDAPDGGRPSYYKEGFLTIQNAIAKAFIEQFNNATKKTPEIFVNRFPFPSYKTNVVATHFTSLLPLIILISLNYTFMNTIRFISMEKEKQLKEAMKIMGLAGWMHYLSWFIRTMIMLSISMILITFLLTTPCFGSSMAFFPNTSFLCLIILFAGYCICLTTFGFVICAIFTQSKSAMTGSTIVWYLSSAPYFILDGKYDELPGWLKLLFCICPNSAMGYGFKIIGYLEQMELGLNWHTVFETASVYDNLSVAKIFGIFMLTSILMFFLTLYLENVISGGYGVAKPWYFVFTRDFWRNLNNYQQFENHRSADFESYESLNSNANKSNFESEPMNKTIGIEIRNLTKKFQSDKAAVSNLSLNIYNNQITCLLGQNGAGKTTTISMLTGMMEPTSGTAVINGCNIRTNMDMARNSMGFCPQHNILFDELTVREHILFYCRLKGLSNEATECEIRKYGHMLELSNKMDTLSTALSGGMKRKLSVVIALCGGSKVVFLDEPTSGMDPGARRTLWDILLAEKKDRTILLTTHFMDEADVLSDRIAILANGELKCSGSTFFLKRRFGTGYHLICAKDTDCNSRAITDLLQTHIDEIQLEHENDTEITYLLPEEKNYLFTKIFEDLEKNVLRLNLRSFGVSLTTLEEIFLKLGKSDKIDATHSQTPQSSDSNSVISDTRITLNDDQFLLRGVDLWRNQAIAMFKKRFLCWIRAWHSFLYYNLFVIFLLSTVTFEFGNIFSKSNKLPALEITLDKYKSPYAIMPANASVSNDIAAQYKKNIEHSSAKYLPVHNDDLQDGLLNLAHQSIRPFIFQYLTGASFHTNGTIVAWFNGQAYHSAALALNLVHNAIAKRFLDDEYGINLTNEPLKFLPTNDSTAEYFEDNDSFGYLFAMMIGVVMSILSASYITFYIKEKECNSKFMQYASGAYLSIFWGTSILWDLFTNTIINCTIIIMLILGQHEQWKSPSELAIVFLILFVYNFAMIPIICIASLIFSKPTTGMNVMSFANIIVLFIFLTNEPLHFLYEIVRFIFWAYPICTMTDGMFKLPKLHTLQFTCESNCKEIFNATECDWNKMCKLQSLCCSTEIFSWSDLGIGKNLVLMIATGICAYIVLLLIEVGAFKFIRTMILKLVPRTYPEHDPTDVDDDVLAEKQRIDIMDENELSKETLVMQNVSKFYGQFCAVNQISVAIKRGECFGLLGKNGAGKSSIFKMLTGETMITNGQIFTQGYNQQTELSHIYQIIGYCPQFDALQNSLTCRETLEIYAMLRGISSQDVRHYIENCARSLDFIQHIDKKVKQLSGGNKRKLSTSLAIIGNLSVIFLDEPTTGMDPATKRNLWNVVIQSREAGKSIVLTSHSMEECEALCTRMTVLVNGLCKCLGSAQHLKNKFTKGFELKIKVKDDETMHNDIIEAKNFVLQKFTGAIFREEYQGILTYSIPAENIKWSYVFSIMENAKTALNIEDYSVSQRGLEQVVLTLVKDQETRRNQK